MSYCYVMDLKYLELSPHLMSIIYPMNFTIRPGHRPKHNHPVRRPHIQRQGSWQRSRPVQRPEAPPPPSPPPRLHGQGTLCSRARGGVWSQALPGQGSRPGEGERKRPTLVEITQRGSGVLDAQTGGLLGTSVHVACPGLELSCTKCRWINTCLVLCWKFKTWASSLINWCNQPIMPWWASDVVLQ